MTESHETNSKVPIHLWIVGVVSLLWNAMGAFDYFMTQTQNEAYMEAFTPEQLEFFYGFPTWAVAVWAIAVWGSVFGSVLLLLRKQIAVPVFLASFIAMVMMTIHNFVLSNGMEIMGGDIFSIVFTILIFVVSLLLYLYARRQQQNGVLN
jgi:hypothetical protein